MIRQWSGLMAIVLLASLQVVSASRYLKQVQGNTRWKQIAELRTSHLTELEMLETSHLEGHVEADSKQDSMAHPPGADYNKETVVVWVDKSQLPLSIEAAIALIWISMVASMPVVMVKLEARPVTHVQVVQFSVMWICLFGGVYLFTNVLLFSSIHFTTVRSLTMVETVYLMSQILTTVGYGDITPAKPRGQLFVALYVFGSILIIASVVSDAASMVMEKSKEFAKKLEDHTVVLEVPTDGEPRSPKSPKLPSPRVVKETTMDKEERLQEWRTTHAPKLPWAGLMRSLGVFGSMVMLGVVFFVCYPGEGKTVFQGFYMSIITLSTVGFGAFTPVTEGGKVFAAFWMFFGSTALVSLVSSFTELMLAFKMREQFDPMKEVQEEKALLEKCPERMTKLDFVKFSLLCRKKVDEAEFDKLAQLTHELFEDMDADKSGHVDRMEAVRFLHDKA